MTLTIEDLLYSLGTVVYDETAARIDAYFIAEAIRTAYPQSVKSIFFKSNILYPSIPAIELLKLRTTDSKTLSLIIVNEGTLDGSYEVMESSVPNNPIESPIPSRLPLGLIPSRLPIAISDCHTDRGRGQGWRSCISILGLSSIYDSLNKYLQNNA